MFTLDKIVKFYSPQIIPTDLNNTLASTSNNGHGKYAAPDDETHPARSPLSNSPSLRSPPALDSRNDPGTDEQPTGNSNESPDDYHADTASTIDPPSVMVKQAMDQKVMIHQLLAFVIAKKGSDLHLRVGMPPMMRISGDLKAYNLPAITESIHIRDLMQDLLGKDAIHHFESGRQSRFLVDFDGLGNFEVQLVQTNRQFASSIRVLPTNILSLDDLNVPDVLRRNTVDVCRGLILINGKIGSGRTTTMAALRHEILSTQNCHVVSLSSGYFPDQPSLKGMHSSVLVGPGFDVDTFEEALKIAEKMDPDYIFVMEHLDTQSSTTVRHIVDLARFGFCVVASIHTDSVVEALHQMLGILDYRDREFALRQLSLVLRVSICQRLLRTPGGTGRVACHEILSVFQDVRPAIANFDLDRIGRILSNHAESSSMKRSAKSLLELGLIDAAEFDRV